MVVLFVVAVSVKCFLMKNEKEIKNQAAWESIYMWLDRRSSWIEVHESFKTMLNDINLSGKKYYYAVIFIAKHSYSICSEI